MRLNIYRHRFYCRCPNNGATIAYSLEIEASAPIMVEDIVAACLDAERLPMPYHETIADKLLERFGGTQRLRAYHHGVEIETVRA